MRRSFLTYLIFLSSTSIGLVSYAQAEDTPSDMEVVMERMDDSLKLISKGIRAETINELHLNAIEALQADATEAALLPLSDQAICLQLLYQTSMLELIGEALEMENQMEIAMKSENPRDMAGITAVWKRMSKLRKQGHKDCQKPE